MVEPILYLSTKRTIDLMYMYMQITYLYLILSLVMNGTDLYIFGYETKPSPHTQIHTPSILLVIKSSNQSKV